MEVALRASISLCWLYINDDLTLTDFNSAIFFPITSVGAAGPILGEAVDRISAALSEDGNVSADERDATIRRSFVLSSDQAHALHPNYASKHEKSHQVSVHLYFRLNLISLSSNELYGHTTARNERWYGDQTKLKPTVLY